MHPPEALTWMEKEFDLEPVEEAQKSPWGDRRLGRDKWRLV